MNSKTYTAVIKAAVILSDKLERPHYPCKVCGRESADAQLRGITVTTEDKVTYMTGCPVCITADARIGLVLAVDRLREEVTKEALQQVEGN